MLERGRLSNADYKTKMSESRAYSTVDVLRDIIGASAAAGGNLAGWFDRMVCPVVAVPASETPGEQRIVYCNDAFCELVGEDREALLARSLQSVYPDEVNAEAGQRLIQVVQREGAARMTLALAACSGEARRVELTGVRVDPSTGLTDGAAIAMLARPLGRGGPIPAGAPVSDTYRAALLVETLLRCYIRENYRQGMHPAQWSALRFFKLASPEERTLTSFAKSHHTTMGTASTTVSTLVGKGYLKKHGFRGPIEITADGEKVLYQDPLGTVAEVLEKMPEDERAWTRHSLKALVEGLDGDSD